MKVSIQGERASFHEMAARAYFKQPVEALECLTFKDVCRTLVDGQSDSAIMAVENTLVGSILPNYALLNEFPVVITGEIYLRIEQNLMALPKQQLKDISIVRSHPMALRQCSHFFRQHSHLNALEAFDTAGSAREIREQNLPGTAAIASQAAAERYQLEILAPGIEDQKHNYTRFFSLSRRTGEPGFSGSKSTLYFKLKHQVGALARMLNIFQTHAINLNMIQSLPVPLNPNEYGFLIEVVWQKAVDFQTTLAEAQTCSSAMKILGVYEPGLRPFAWLNR